MKNYTKIIPNSISKKFLWKYINFKLKNIVRSDHVLSIMHILFDELIKDLKSGRKINITNFGVLSLNKTNPRRYHNVVLNKVVLSKGGRILRFVLSRKIKSELIKKIDLESTFKKDNK